MTDKNMPGLLSFGPSDAPGLAQWLPALIPVAFGVVLSGRANPDIADCIRPSIAKTCHDVLIATGTAKSQHSAFGPNPQPFLECQQERNAALLGRTFMVYVGAPLLMVCRPFNDVVSHRLWIGRLPFAGRSNALRSVGGIIGSRIGLPFFAMGRIAGTFARQEFISASFGHSRWLLSLRTRVRGGIGAATLMPFRLYRTKQATS